MRTGVWGSLYLIRRAARLAEFRQNWFSEPPTIPGTGSRQWRWFAGRPDVDHKSREFCIVLPMLGPLLGEQMKTVPDTSGCCGRGRRPL